MEVKDQTLHDLNTDQFTHLKRKENKVLLRVDVNELNKRLNENKRSNFYTTALAITLCLSCLVILSIIGFIF